MMMFSLLQLFDVSEDGKLDLAEYTDGMLAYGFSTEDAHAGFAKFAAGKQTIDFLQFKARGRRALFGGWERWRKSLQKLWNEYFYSTIRSKPGNYLFGLFDGIKA